MLHLLVLRDEFLTARLLDPKKKYSLLSIERKKIIKYYIEKVKRNYFRSNLFCSKDTYFRTEGENTWLILDFGDIIDDMMHFR